VDPLVPCTAAWTRTVPLRRTCSRLSSAPVPPLPAIFIPCFWDSWLCCGCVADCCTIVTSSSSSLQLCGGADWGRFCRLAVPLPASLLLLRAPRGAAALCLACFCAALMGSFAPAALPLLSPLEDPSRSGSVMLRASSCFLFGLPCSPCSRGLRSDARCPTSWVALAFSASRLLWPPDATVAVSWAAVFLTLAAGLLSSCVTSLLLGGLSLRLLLQLPSSLQLQLLSLVSRLLRCRAEPASAA